MGGTAKGLSKSDQFRRNILMLFVTVGTHESQFDRLIKHIDEIDWKKEVMMQIGYCTYKPKNYRYEKFLSYKKMMEFVEEAKIIITHGGPSSIFLPLQIGKVPIVVPRRKEFGEHVNDHQVEFTEKIRKTESILAVNHIEEIDNYIKNYETIVLDKKVSLSSNNASFNDKLARLLEGLL